MFIASLYCTCKNYVVLLQLNYQSFLLHLRFFWSAFCFLLLKFWICNKNKTLLLGDCNWTRTNNHLVHKRTLNHLAKLAKWLSCVLSTFMVYEYIYGVWCIWLYVLIMSRARFRVNPHSLVAWMSRNYLLKAVAKSEV